MANTRSTKCDRGQLTIGNGIPCTSHTIFQSNVHAYFINIGQARQKRDTTTHLVGASLVQKAGEPRIKKLGLTSAGPVLDAKAEGCGCL